MTTQTTEREFQSNIDKLVRKTEIESSLWKSLTLGILSAFSAFGFSYFLHQLISSASANVWPVFIFLFVFSVLFLFKVILITNPRMVYWWGLLDTVALSLFFVFNLASIWVIFSFVFSALFLFWSGYYGKKEADNYLKMRFFRLGKVVLSRFFTAISFFVAFSYVSIFATGSVSLISKDFLNSSLNSGSSLVSSFYPNFSFDSTLRSNIESIISDQIDKKDGLLVSPEQKNLEVNRGVLIYTKSLSETIGLPVDIDSKTSDFIHSILTFKFSELVKNYGLVAYFALVFIIFLILRSAAYLFYWPILILSFPFFHILRAFGFYAVLLETRSKEVIVMN